MVKVFIALAVLSALLALWSSTDKDKELIQWVCVILSGIMFILSFVAFIFNQ